MLKKREKLNKVKRMLKLLKPKKGNNFNRAVNVNEGGWMRERVNGVYIKKYKR